MNKKVVWLCFAACCGIAYLANFTIRPSRQALVNGFVREKIHYLHLREMLRNDRNIQSVADWGVLELGSPTTLRPPFPGMTEKRYNEYIGELALVGSKSIIRASIDSEDYCFLMWRAGWGGDSAHVAICSLASTPPPTDVSIYHEAHSSTTSGNHFDPIGDGWYLRWDD